MYKKHEADSALKQIQLDIKTLQTEYYNKPNLSPLEEESNRARVDKLRKFKEHLDFHSELHQYVLNAGNVNT